MLAPNQLASLHDMLEINAQSFHGATAELRRQTTILNSVKGDDESKPEPHIRQLLQKSNEQMIAAINVIGARAAGVSAERLQARLLNNNDDITFGELRRALEDIEARFADELGFIKLFVIDQQRSSLFGGADFLLGQETADAFPSAWFDCEEAAKCLCVGRPTACVFHCMRLLEIAIGALSRRLQIEDPIKPGQRNWGAMLKAIKTELENQHPSASRSSGSEGALIEKLYLSLDAVKNPWRNETMHVEGVYTEAEAQHILQCVAVLLQTMATGFDEDGNDVTGPDLGL